MGGRDQADPHAQDIFAKAQALVDNQTTRKDGGDIYIPHRKEEWRNQSQKGIGWERAARLHQQR